MTQKFHCLLHFGFKMCHESHFDQPDVGDILEFAGDIPLAPEVMVEEFGKTERDRKIGQLEYSYCSYHFRAFRGQNLIVQLLRKIREEMVVGIEGEEGVAVS